VPPGQARQLLPQLLQLLQLLQLVLVVAVLVLVELVEPLVAREVFFLLDFIDRANCCCCFLRSFSSMTPSAGSGRIMLISQLSP
jgi:hypothetical protein